MGSKFLSALRCFIRRPTDTVRIMLSLEQYDPKAVEAIKAHCPDVEVEKLGMYVGVFLAILLLACGVAAYILALLYSMGYI
ncbi:MAG: hypothetical protein EFT35_09480 [Methanophagales archaeon ANME-1-THS]|nr:MAG: hypothetical protein EFT35_09480 [Methanophagales archaeon ANME-1-THS]